MAEHKEKKSTSINPVIKNTKSSEATVASLKEENVLSEDFNQANTSSNVNILIQEEQTEEVPEIEKNVVVIKSHSFNQMVAKINVLQAENRFLKESIQRFENLKEENNKNFKKIQVQLDQIFDLLKSNISYSARTDASTSKSDEHIKKIADSGITFPINTIEHLNLLEEKLVDEGFEKDLIKEFSSICGTSGKQRISKIGLNVSRCLFTDELLNQLTWKGIKGTQKVPLLKFNQIRQLFHKIVKLADSSCSAKDSDMFLQNSAIKHSGQRLKRKSSQGIILHPKKNKTESEKENTAKNTNETTTTDQKCMTTENDKEPSTYNEKETIADEEDPLSTYSETILILADEIKKEIKFINK